jgi:peptidoglycan/LPS O-acetylase OafA/YrhL
VTPMPRAVRVAGTIVALQGGLALVTAVVLTFREASGHREAGISGYGTAAWFVIMGAGVLAAGWALWTGRQWGRGIAVFVNLLLLGVAFYVFTSGQLGYAVLVAVVSVAVLALLFNSSTVHWLTQSPADDER